MVDDVFRVIFPDDENRLALPTYVSPTADFKFSFDDEVGKFIFFSDEEVKRFQEEKCAEILDLVKTYNRNSITLNKNSSLVVGSFFNSFPITYYKMSTSVNNVTLEIIGEGSADIIVKLSDQNAQIIHEETKQFNDKNNSKLNFNIPMSIADENGGHLFFEIKTTDNEFTLLSGKYFVDQELPDYKASIGITTFNLPDDCVKQMNRFAQDEHLLNYIEEIIITDQGTKKVRDAKGFNDAQAKLDTQFRLIEQGNLGGSGGFARGMLECVLGGVKGTEKKADAVILLDDDVKVETECIRRSIIFASLCKEPTLVGGHMFSLEIPNHLLNQGEEVEEDKWIWKSIEKFPSINMARHNYLKAAQFAKIHKPTHNGWWMCLIPKVAIEDIGLSFPGFIKWDDVEYGYRATKAGYKVVTLPSVGVWHLSWAGKIDLWDWQAYYHLRNRLTTCLIHSPYKKSRKLLKISRRDSSALLVSMHYGAEELRIQALEDVLKGPNHLHETIGTKNAELRQIIKETDDGKNYPLEKDSQYYQNYLETSKDFLPKPAPYKPLRIFVSAFALLYNAIHKTSNKNKKETFLMMNQMGWWKTYLPDKVTAFSLDGSKRFTYNRDSQKYKELNKKDKHLHKLITDNWENLASDYQKEFKKLISPQMWIETFNKNA